MQGSVGQSRLARFSFWIWSQFHLYTWVSLIPVFSATYLHFVLDLNSASFWSKCICSSLFRWRLPKTFGLGIALRGTGLITTGICYNGRCGGKIKLRIIKFKIRESAFGVYQAQALNQQRK